MNSGAPKQVLILQSLNLIMLLNQPWKRHSPTKSPRKSPTKKDNSPKKGNNKIQHEIQNDGCKCALCQRLAIEKMKVIKDDVPAEMLEEKKQLNVKKTKQPYYVKYLTHFYMLDRGKKRLRMMIPEICVFEKGVPHYMFTKKKQNQPLKLIRNKQKLNFYEVKNFFYEGFVYHNRQIDASCAQKPSKSVTFQIRDKQALKNECIVIARYSNNPGQIMSPSMMDNLFKSSQRQFRAALLYMQTIINSKSYQELRVRIDLETLKDQAIYQRAKNQIRIMNQEIKNNDLGFVPEKDEADFEEVLKRSGFKKYLEYLSLKLTLLHSYKAEKAIQEATFKFARGAFGDYYYFVDLNVHRFCDREKIWGILILEENIQQSAQNKLTLREDLELKYRHLQGNTAIRNLEQVMYDSYTNSKVKYLGDMTDRPYCQQLQHSNLENKDPEKNFRIGKSRLVSRRASSNFALY